jgi:hypothetical protein
VVTNVILGAVLLALLAGFVAFYRYSRTEAFRHGDVRRATLSLLMTIGPFFGVHPERPEPAPTSVSTPKGDDEPDPLAERVDVTTPEPRHPGEERNPPRL